MGTVTANGIAISHRIEGPEGAPWVTFSNSLATNLSMWDGQAAALHDDFRVLRYDTRGHGGSAASEGDYSFDLLVADVVALWDALGIDRSHFVGLSLGGMTGMGLGLSHPERLSKLVMCDCRADAPQPFVDGWVERRAAIRESGIEVIVEGNLQRWFTAELLAEQPPMLDAVRTMIRTTSVEGFLGCTGALMQLDYMSRLGEIGVPSLFVVGANDGPHPEVMKAMHAALPGSEYIVIEGAAHLSNLEQPATFNGALRSFLETG